LISQVIHNYGVNSKALWLNKTQERKALNINNQKEDKFYRNLIEILWKFVNSQYVKDNAHFEWYGGKQLVLDYRYLSTRSPDPSTRIRRYVDVHKYFGLINFGI